MLAYCTQLTDVLRRLPDPLPCRSLGLALYRLPDDLTTADVKQWCRSTEKRQGKFQIAWIVQLAWRLGWTCLALALHMPCTCLAVALRLPCLCLAFALPLPCACATTCASPPCQTRMVDKSLPVATRLPLKYTSSHSPAHLDVRPVDRGVHGVGRAKTVDRRQSMWIFAARRDLR